MTVLAVDILAIPKLGTLALSRSLEWVFLVLLPNFCLGQGLNDFFTNYQFLQVCDTPMVRQICDMHLPQPFPCCKGKGPCKRYVTLFSWKLDPHPPRNANNVEPYTFVTFFYRKILRKKSC